MEKEGMQGVIEELVQTKNNFKEALNGLYQAFKHTEGNIKGNKAKTDIITYNKDIKEALKVARETLSKNV